MKAPRKSLLVAGLVTLSLAATTAAAASPGAAHLPLFFSFDVQPTKISRTERVPVWMELTGKYLTEDGSHVPAAKMLQLQMDRHLALDLKGVPACRRPRPDIRRNTGQMEDLCRKSIVGRGELSVEVAFPEVPMTTVSERLVVFKADGRAAGIDLMVFAFLPAPVTSELVIPIDVRRIGEGRIGWEAHLSIPKIAGGNGSLTDYSLRIGKRILLATCVGQRFELRAVATFTDGSRLPEKAIRVCGVAEADPRQ
jgi:hypothetical protein